MADTGLHVQATCTHTLSHTFLLANPQTVNTTSFDGTVGPKEEEEQGFRTMNKFERPLCGPGRIIQVFQSSPWGQHLCNVSVIPETSMTFYTAKNSFHSKGIRRQTHPQLLLFHLPNFRHFLGRQKQQH